MNSQVAWRAFSGSAELIGMAQFQIELTRRPLGPLGQRAKPILPMTFERSGLAMTVAAECPSMKLAIVPCANASAMSGQFQFCAAFGANALFCVTYHSSAATASGLLTLILPPASNHFPPNAPRSEG